MFALYLMHITLSESVLEY